MNFTNGYVVDVLAKSHVYQLICHAYPFNRTLLAPENIIHLMSKDYKKRCFYPSTIFHVLT
jgi:hypothetical protein